MTDTAKLERPSRVAHRCGHVVVPRWATVWAVVWIVGGAVGCDDVVSPMRSDERDAIPDEAACDAVREWPSHRDTVESELLIALDIARDREGNCPTGETFAGAPPLRDDGALRCAARNLAVHLAEFDNLVHTDGDGNSVVDRIAAAGRDTVLATELVAAGDIAAARVVDELWLASGPHCAALRADAWTDVGVAYIENPQPVDPDVPVDDDASWGAYWVVVLATPTR